MVSFFKDGKTTYGIWKYLQLLIIWWLSNEGCTLVKITQDIFPKGNCLFTEFKPGTKNFLLKEKKLVKFSPKMMWENLKYTNLFWTKNFLFSWFRNVSFLFLISSSDKFLYSKWWIFNLFNFAFLNKLKNKYKKKIRKFSHCNVYKYLTLKC